MNDNYIKEKNYQLIDKLLNDNSSLDEIANNLHNVDKHELFYIFDKKQFILYFIKNHRPDKLYYLTADDLNLI